MAGQIVIVNGTSGSGKSTACELFAKESDEFWLSYGIDQFLGSTLPARFSHHGPRCEEGISAHPLDELAPDGPLRWRLGEWGARAFGVFHEWIAAASREGCNIIVDHLLLVDPPVLQDLIWRTRDLPVLLVTLHPPYEVLMERVATRAMGNRFPGSNLTEERAAQIRERLDRLRPWFYEAIYANDIADLVIDTTRADPLTVCERIRSRLAAGPGDAFQRLREKYPQP